MGRLTASIILVGMLIATHAQTMQAETLTRDESCQSSAWELAQDGLEHLSIGALTGCVADFGNDEWSWPNEASFPVTDQEAVTVRGRITTQLARLRSAFEAAPGLNGSNRTLWDDVQAVAELQTCSFRWGVGDRPLTSSESAEFGAQYQTFAAEVFGNPSMAELDIYVRWWVEYRLLGLPQHLVNEAVSHDPNPQGRSYVDQMGFFRPPWFWEIDRPSMINRFLQWQLDTGQL